jgi:hypothetical protein
MDDFLARARAFLSAEAKVLDKDSKYDPEAAARIRLLVSWTVLLARHEAAQGVLDEDELDDVIEQLEHELFELQTVRDERRDERFSAVDYMAKLNDEIHGVLVAAQLEQGLSAAETARAAAAGELEGLPPTGVSETLCRELAAEARRARGQEAEAHVVSPAPVDVIATRAQAILEQEIARYQEKAERGGLKPNDASALKRLLQVAREVKAIRLGFLVPGSRSRRLADEQRDERNGDGAESAILAAIEESEAESADDE